MAVAEARLVLAKASTASVPAEKAEPALKPNHPNHNNPVPKSQTGCSPGLLLLIRRGDSAAAAHPADTHRAACEVEHAPRRSKPSGCQACDERWVHPGTNRTEQDGREARVPPAARDEWG